MNDSNIHLSVLLHEAVDALVTRTSGRYIDATFGRGGHSALILERLIDPGRLIAIDRDQTAIEAGKARFRDESRVSFVQSEFSGVGEIADRAGWSGGVSGILLDFGLSSPQIDNAERGFSFINDGPLDMRMNQSAGVSAADWLHEVALEDLIKVLREYGEERFARRIANAIVNRRTQGRICSTAELAALVAEATPVKDPHKHPATRTFQAVRIQVNSELDEIQRVLNSALQLLGDGGRLVAISFHSLEDRIVKRFMREHSRPAPLPREIPMRTDLHAPPLRLVGKAVRASAAEVAANPRARSAIMRIAERNADHRSVA